MALEMRTACERCERPLGHADDALICSFECTFCPACADAMDAVCPNCGGELVARPRRAEPGG
jgi:uncharacterized protein